MEFNAKGKGGIMTDRYENTSFAIICNGFFEVSWNYRRVGLVGFYGNLSKKSILIRAALAAIYSSNSTSIYHIK